MPPRAEPMGRGEAMARGAGPRRTRWVRTPPPPGVRVSAAGGRRAAASRPLRTPAAVRRIVLARTLVGELRLCEACGLPLYASGTHMSHRVRARDGAATPANLCAVHPLCHVLGAGAIHRELAWAAARGLVLPFAADPAAEPLWLPAGRWVLLHPTLPRYLPVTSGAPPAPTAVAA